MQMDIEKKNDFSIEIFRMKKLFKRLQSAKINGSVITIILPPKKAVSEATKMLNEEIGKSSNIKDRTNRNSVNQAQISARERLKLYQRAPNNGLILFCGRIMDEGSATQRKIICDFEPFKPVNLSIYSCQSKFVLDELKRQLLVNEPPFGFIIVDGQGALYATLEGNAKQIVNKFTVELPKKHNKGGQSSVRFARLRDQKRHNYLRKVCELAVASFITDNKCNVRGLILAGSADFKNDLNRTDMFDPRLQTKVVNIVDVSYGFENGLNQAIQKSTETLLNVKFMKEKKLISNFFQHIALSDGLVVYGVQDTMKLLNSGAIGKIICYENLQHFRVKLKNPQTQSISYIYVKPQNLGNKQLYLENNIELERVELDEDEPNSLAEWLAMNYNKFGCQLQFITDKSPQGTQFVKGFSGIGGILRYKIELEHILNDQEQYEEDQDDENFM